jgi:cation-transporting ATPase E
VDKTGTLTEPGMHVRKVVTLTGSDAQLTSAMAALASVESAPNPTLQAVADAYPQSTWTSTSHVPFSSARKWSGASFDQHGTWILGAPEMVLDANDGALQQAEQLASDGSRVLVVGTIVGELTVDQQLTGVVPIGLVVTLIATFCLGVLNGAPQSPHF